MPAHAFDETAEQLAARWTREARARDRRHGDQAGVHEDRRGRRRRCRRSTRSWCAPRRSRIARPACRSRRTPARGGGDGGARPARAAGVPLSRSSGCTRSPSGTTRFHARAAKRGAWVEFDGISPASVDAPCGRWCGDEDRRAARPRARVARRRLVSRRRARRRPVPPVRHAVHRLRAGTEDGGFRRCGRSAVAGRESAARVVGATRTRRCQSCPGLSRTGVRLKKRTLRELMKEIRFRYRTRQGGDREYPRRNRPRGRRPQ